MSTSNKLVFLLFVVASFTIPSIAYNHDYKVLKETKMTLYFQDFFGGPNATSIIYAGIPGKAWNYDSFGATIVTDDAMTKAPDKNSPEIARAQGIIVTSSLDGSNAHALFSIVFTSKKYSGSSLEIQGSYPQSDKLGELAVVGGTGKFRFAKGFALLDRISAEVNPIQVYSVTRCNLTVVHY